ncbi:hypothetical protein AB0K62_13825 [Streptomyces halstedii]|uniref:hypothetical protein n=1 Tax=Streptomyces halstedii TaxID=1944 RepID=UPI003460EDB3
MAKLARSVHVTDPKSGRRLVLAPGEEPASHLAVLVTNPAAWEDGKPPGLPKVESGSRTGSAQGAASGDASEASGAADTTPAEDAASEDAKPAAKRAARKPARGRAAAAEGAGGQ